MGWLDEIEGQTVGLDTAPLIYLIEEHPAYLPVVRPFRDILTNARNLSIAELSVPIAERAARLRASTSLRTPDAVQLAAALEHGARFFLTNDGRLPAVEGLKLFVLDDLR